MLRFTANNKKTFGFCLNDDIKTVVVKDCSFDALQSLIILKK